MWKRSIIPLVLFLVTGGALHAQQVNFQANVDRNEVDVGDAVKFTIELSNASSGGSMTTPDWGGMTVVQGPYESNSFSSINGSISRSTSRSWYLTATQPGDFTIGASTAHIGNSVLHTQAIRIHVDKGSSTGASSAESDQAQKKDPNLFCTITLSKSKAYVGEQVIATYTLFSRYNSLQPGNYDLPKLSGFWAEEVQLGETNWERVPRTVNGLRYNVAVLKKQVLIPLHSGKLRVEPMTLNFRVNPGFFSNGTPVSIQSNASEVSVMELPSNKPADFMGAVGDLRLEVDAPKPNVKANEAIDLTIRFSGRANLKLIDAPKLDLPPDFESYDPKVDDKITVNGSGMSGSREFQYLLIPRHEGKYDLGTLTFSYFDPESNSYRPLRSGDLKFDVAPGAASGSAIVGVPMKTDVKQLASDIRYIRTGDLDLRPVGHHLFGSWKYAAGMLLPPALLLLLFLWKRRRDERMGDVQGQRRRGADKVARQRLAAAETAMKNNDRAAFHDALGKALEGYFADKFNLGVAEVNAATITEKLGTLEEGKLAKDYTALMEECEMARFAPIESKPSQTSYGEAASLIRRIEHRHRT